MKLFSQKISVGSDRYLLEQLDNHSMPFICLQWNVFGKFWQQCSPNFFSKGNLVNWCVRQGIM